MPRSAIFWAGLLLVCFSLGGCDKCGHPIKLNAPSVPDACYETPQDK